MKLFIMFAMTFFASLAFADDAAALPHYLDGITAWLATHPVTSFSVIIAVVADLGLRLYPSEKALSVLLPVKYALDGVKAILGWLSDLVNTLVTAAQNLKK